MKERVSEIPISPSQDAPDLSRLADMTKEELIVLLSQIRGIEYALMTEDEQYEAACRKLFMGGMSEKDIWKALPSLKEWMDRRKGKPAQSIAMTVEDKGLGKLATDRLLRLAAMLDEPVVIPPL